MPIHCDVEHVNKRLKQNQALKDVSLHFEKGLLHGIIGPDGAGKTTLLRTLAGLLRPDQGGFQFFEEGRPLALADARLRMAYMPQQQSLYADLSIAEHLDFFRDLHRIPTEIYRERRASLLHMTRLDKFVDRPAGKLSGGMYKKLGLMCSLLQSPDILLLDEPTNGVDPISRREFWDMLYEFREKRILILIATAYMDEAERCDRVHVINEGRTLAAGEPRSLMVESGAASFQDYFLQKIGVSA